MSCQCTDDPCAIQEAAAKATPLEDLIPVLEEIGFELIDQGQGWRLYGKATRGILTRPIAYRLLKKIQLPFLHLNKDVETSLLGFFSQFKLFTDQGTLDGGYVEALVNGPCIEDREIRIREFPSLLKGRRMSYMKVAIVWQNPESLPEFQ